MLTNNSTHPYRTHNCGELTTQHTNSLISLSGWIHNIRDHGKLIFIDLRDHYGLTQCVVEEGTELFQAVSHLHCEYIVSIQGTVVNRDAAARNPNLPTGNIEIRLEQLKVLAKSAPLPFSVNNNLAIPEEFKFKYRYLALRRQANHDILTLRAKVLTKAREIMNKHNFCEIQTPILTGSSPEGARDYLVPSRLHKGKFYALPQAPQQFKQLLMVAGFDRYFQIAPCFRDEDSRQDRLPGEFYQLDLEMSFVEQEEVLQMVETIIRELFNHFTTINPAAWLRFTYHEALQRYGSDKPDLRNPLIIKDVEAVFLDGTFAIFNNALKAGEKIKAIKVEGKYIKDSLPGSFFKEMESWAKTQGLKGLAFLTLPPVGVSGIAGAPLAASGTSGKGIAKFLDAAQHLKLQQALDGFTEDDVVFFIADLPSKVCKLAGMVRTELARRLELFTQGFEFCWITDFPFYELDEGKINFCHNPFSLPQGGMEALKTQDPLSINAYQYDLVCNGYELASGAIRNHDVELMYQAFAIAGYNAEQVDTQFKALIEAFKFGAPPHGGCAPGLDRIIMLLAGVHSVREVVAFPLNQSAADPLMGCPAVIEPRLLKELGLNVIPEKMEESR